MSRAQPAMTHKWIKYLAFTSLKSLDYQINYFGEYNIKYRNWLLQLTTTTPASLDKTTASYFIA